jgi:hypothetical protein
MPKQNETWQFTVTDRRGKVRATVTITAKRSADVLEALARLKAPVATVRLVHHNGVGMIRRFSWDTPTGRVVGARL